MHFCLAALRFATRSTALSSLRSVRSFALLSAALRFALRCASFCFSRRFALLNAAHRFALRGASLSLSAELRFAHLHFALLTAALRFALHRALSASLRSTRRFASLSTALCFELRGASLCSPRWMDGIWMNAGFAPFHLRRNFNVIPLSHYQVARQQNAARVFFIRHHLTANNCFLRR
jgi:hypothetical protein